MDAIFHGVSAGERERLGWTASPDLAAEVRELAEDLNSRFAAVFNTLGRRPLLIADQFDDHQAQHRNLYLDDEANWLSPSVVVRRNSFWKIVNAGLKERRMHLLVVTRSDTAAGLTSVRFLNEDQCVARTLPRVDAEYLRPLLAEIAPDDAVPTVVSNPGGGWVELRERLEMDLRTEGAVLMQQVRTALLGLRQLPLLTPGRYRSAGGLRGIETLFITRALHRASQAVGGRDVDLNNARAVLGRLILPGGPNQMPKAQRASMDTLSEVAGGDERAKTVLEALQREEVIRPAETAGGIAAWQLDHDYLARAVLAEASQADRWSIALRAGKDRYDRAWGSWRLRWKALLPFRTLIRIGWELARHRLILGDAAAYARRSALKPLTVLFALILLGGGVYFGGREVLNYGIASNLVNQFGGASSSYATLTIWRASEGLRRRVFAFMNPDGRFIRNSAVRFVDFRFWPLAHAGLEPAPAREVAAVLRGQLLATDDPAATYWLSGTYSALIGRMDAQSAKSEATWLRAQLEHPPSTVSDRETALAVSYAAAAARLTDEVDLVPAAELVRNQMMRKGVSWSGGASLTSAYGTIAGRLSKDDVRHEATVLRSEIEKQNDDEAIAQLVEAYALLAARLEDESDMRAAADALRVCLEHELASVASSGSNPVAARAWPPGSAFAYVLRAFSTVSDRLGAADAAAEATILRARVETEPEGAGSLALGNAYAALSDRLEKDFAKAELRSWRTVLERNRGQSTSGIQLAYAAVALETSEPADVDSAAALLRPRLRDKQVTATPNQLYLQSFTTLRSAYVEVAGNLSAKGARIEASAVRQLLEKESDSEIACNLAQTYAVVATRLTEPSEIEDAAAAIRAALDRVNLYDPNIRVAVEAYAKAAERLDDANAKVEASILDARMAKKPNDDLTRIIAAEYASVATKMTAASDVKLAAATLRERLDREVVAGIKAASSVQYVIESRTYVGIMLEQAYETLAARLQGADAQAEASILRERIQREGDERIAASLVGSYASVAARLSNPAQVTDAAAFVRDRMEWVSYADTPDLFARAYAQLATVVLARPDTSDRVPSVTDVLTLAGHPYLADRSALLAVLKPSSKLDFGQDVAAAVSWAERTYKIKPSQLRPSPLPQEIPNSDGTLAASGAT